MIDGSSLAAAFPNPETEAETDETVNKGRATKKAVFLNAGILYFLPSKSNKNMVRRRRPAASDRQVILIL